MVAVALDASDTISSNPPVQVQVISQWEAALQSMVEEKVRSWYKLANQGIFTRRRTKGGIKPLRGNGIAAGASACDSSKHHKKHRGAEGAAVPPLAVDVVVEYGEEAEPESAALIEAYQKQQLERKLAKGERARAVWGLISVAILGAPAAACLLFALLSPAIFTTCLTIWAVLEVVFVVVRYFQLRYASDHRPDLTSPSLEAVNDLLSRILKLKGIVSARYFFEGWFHGTPLERLSREHIKQFIAFGFFYRSFDQLSPEYQEAVEGHMDSIESVWDLPILRRPSASASPSASSSASSSASASVPALPPSTDQQQAPQQQQRAQPHQGGGSTAGALAGAAMVVAAGAAAVLVEAADVAETAAVEVVGEAAAAVEGGLGVGAYGEEGEQGKQGEGMGTYGEDGVEFMAHTREPLRAMVHPLFVYAWGHMVGWATGFALSVMRFHKHVSPLGLHYWHRVPRQARKAAAADTEGYDAVVFIHGLGIGLTPYLAFIHMLLAAFGRKPFIVVELPHLACQLTNASPTIEEVTAALVEVLRKHGYKRVSYIGHSYSTFIAATFLRRHRSMVAAMSIIDPVCVLLCLPKVLSSFVYQLPGGSHLAARIGEIIRWSLCSRELQVARSICRGFAWQEYQIWGDELPPASLVMLAGDDQLVPSPQVQSHLARHNVDVIYNDGFQHAEFLTKPDVQHKFVMAYAATCAKISRTHVQ